MTGSAKLYLLEMVLYTNGANSPIVPMQDLNMLAVLHGKERSLGEFDSLLEKAGLRRTTATQTRSPMWVIEAVVST